MSQVTTSAIVNTLANIGFSRISKRVVRHTRYRWFYPWGARYLFPMVALKDDVFVNPMAFCSFHENSATCSSSCAQLLEQAQNICGHRFAFLNVPPVNLGTRVNWHFGQNGDPLWKYTLHYGEWALTLTHAFLITGQTQFRDALMGLMDDWVENHCVGQDPGWDPYPTSRRLLAWSRAGLAMKGDKPWQEFWRARLAPSLHQQARFLARNLEEDLGNNHLIANYGALASMGLIFPGWPEAERWRNVGLTGLWEEMRRQVLSDGVHDERSISYHTIVLQDMLEVWRLCLSVKEPVPEDVSPTLQRMLQFLDSMAAPDGSYPMLNDTVPGYPAHPRSLLFPAEDSMNSLRLVLGGGGQDAPPNAPLVRKRQDLLPEDREFENSPSLAVYPQAGYVILPSEGDNQLYFDAGPMGPAHLPGHGHADALSFLLFSGGRWLATDPGVFSYHDPVWRDYFRGTQAHNTVAIDGQDQCLFWGAFRVAYAPAVRLLHWSGDEVAGEHEGYSRLKDPVFHRRHIKKVGPGEWKISDSFSGRGEHDFRFTLQLGLEGEGEISGVNGEIGWPEGISLKVVCDSPPPLAVARLESGWVSPGWNQKQGAPRYILRWRGRVPLENRVILKIEKK